jgi:murein DD-endopeptidase MepM/ murein hydrolase activator NlpD
MLVAVPAYVLAAATSSGATSTLASASGNTAAEDLQKKIDEHQQNIKVIDQEIAQYQKQLDTVSKQKSTLQNKLSQITLSIKKTSAVISSTQNKIGSTQLEIQQLSGDISDTENTIDRDRSGLGESLRRLNEIESRPLAVSVLSSDNLTAAWNDVDVSQTLQSAVNMRIDSLNSEKQLLSNQKSSTETKQNQLQVQKKQLVSQQGSLAATKQTQSEILTQTKAQEANFQNIIAQKQAARSAFESALSDLNSKLQYTVKQSQITTAGVGVLQWPLDNILITQYFGNTAFANSGAYSGKGHNGMDFAASIGTPIHAPLDGVVLGTGNTDSARGCYSFGKWVLLKHANGLDTMYGHLSKIIVSQGQTVQTGDLLGYSGETGYATGPHLHFGVYVSSATQIMKLGDATKQSTPCAGVSMPVAPLSGYLNPLNYLPAGGKAMSGAR